MTLKEIYSWYFELNIVQNKKSAVETLRVIRKYIERLGENRSVKSLNVQVIQKDRLKRLESVKPTTVNAEVSHLREMISQAVLAGKIKSNPLTEISLLKCDNVREVNLKQDDIDRLLKFSPEWLRQIIFMATKMPMRKSEITDLVWNEVNFDLGKHGVIRLPPERVKTEARAIPIQPDVRRMLEKLLGSGSYVFNDREAIKKKFWYEFCKARKQAALEHVTFHDLRHVCITDMFKAGVPQHIIMLLSGHKTDAMFRRYVYLSEEVLYETSW
jgi:integrase